MIPCIIRGRSSNIAHHILRRHKPLAHLPDHISKERLIVVNPGLEDLIKVIISEILHLIEILVIPNLTHTPYSPDLRAENHPDNNIEADKEHHYNADNFQKLLHNI